MSKSKGKYAWMVKVGEKGQIVIPKEACEVFNINPGDTLIVLGDEKQGIAIPPKNAFSKFIMLMSKGFSFIGTEHRLIVGDDEYFCDLLMFNRDLNCMVAIELKIGKFKPAYLGQLSFYLSALDEFEKRPDESNSIGLLLCKEANTATVELTIQDYNKPMGVATFKTASDIPGPYQIMGALVEGVKEVLLDSGIS